MISILAGVLVLEANSQAGLVVNGSDMAPAAHEEGGLLWLNAAWELGVGTQELPGCRCAGEWDIFRSVLNFTLGNAPYDAGPFGSHAAATRLCLARAAPLIQTSVGGDLVGAARSGDFANHPCPAGLLAALALCASVHSELAAVGPGIDASKRDAIWKTRENDRSFDWNWAMQGWLNRIPTDCPMSHYCLAHLEALLAGIVVFHCGHCLETSLWPIAAQEVADNSVNFLYSLYTTAAGFAPPPWYGLRANLRSKPQANVVGAGVFTTAGLPVGEDGSGVSWLLHNTATLWGRSLASDVETIARTSSLGHQHFNTIFGPMHRLWDTAGRGPLGVRLKVHAEDFTGRRQDLRFYIYNLPGPAHAEILSSLHGRIRETAPNPSNCDFGLSPCIELESDGGAFNGYRPYAAEATFLAKLLAAPEGVIVNDSAQASFFVVPFLSSSWCFLVAPKCWVRCGGFQPFNSLAPLLLYFNASTAHRHLFLASDSSGDLPVDLQMQLLTFSYGPNACGEASGPLIGPPPVTDDLPLLEPSDFATKDIFIFAADGVGHRPFRHEAIAELEVWQRRFPHVFVVARRKQHASEVRPPPPSLWALTLRRSLFCPVLPGDNTFRMRLFHAVLAGCIPVVILFPGGSWYRLFGPPVEHSLPFVKKVDWRGLAFEIPHDPREEDFSAWAKRLVPSLLAQGPSEVQAKQRHLIIAARHLRYDFRGQHPDAFTNLLDELVDRAEQDAPAAFECFDPRQRFMTQRCVSGASAVEREEQEVYGAVACCPLSEDVLRTIRASTSRDPCDTWVAGVCVRFNFEGNSSGDVSHSSYMAMQLELRKTHIEAVFAGHRYDGELPQEDQICLR